MPKHNSYRPTLRRQRGDKLVKFAEDEKAPASTPPTEKIDLEKAKHMLFDNPNLTPPRPAWYPNFTLCRSGSFIWPLRKVSHSSMRSNNDTVEGAPAQHQHDSASSEGQAIQHKPSNVSTQSNVSLDSRPGRVNANLILAALGNSGNTNSLHAGDRHSSSSLWNYLFRAMPGARVSHSSNGENTYQPSENDQAFPVGTAM